MTFTVSRRQRGDVPMNSTAFAVGRTFSVGTMPNYGTTPRISQPSRLGAKSNRMGIPGGTLEERHP